MLRARTAILEVQLICDTESIQSRVVKYHNVSNGCKN